MEEPVSLPPNPLLMVLSAAASIIGFCVCVWLYMAYKGSGPVEPVTYTEHTAQYQNRDGSQTDVYRTETYNP